MTSPGTSSRAGGVTHLPSRLTRALIASLAFSAAMALPAWCSSQNPTTALAQQQDQDDEEVRPVPDHARQDHRGLDHPRDRTPEVGEELQERIGLLLLDLVGPVLREPLLRLGLGEPSGESPAVLDLGQGRVFRSSFEIDLSTPVRLISGVGDVRLLAGQCSQLLVGPPWLPACCTQLRDSRAARLRASVPRAHFQSQDLGRCPGRAVST